MITIIIIIIISIITHLFSILIYGHLHLASIFLVRNQATQLGATLRGFGRVNLGSFVLCELETK